MQKINYSFFKTSFILSLFCPVLLFGQASRDGKVHNTEVNKTADVHPELWAKGGTFAGFRPEQEVVDKRTKYAKHFRNADGTFTVQTGDVYHYKDKNGKWQEISLELGTATKQKGYAYSNETNEFKTYFPEQPGAYPVKIEMPGASTFTWWQNPRLNFVVNGQVTQTLHPGEAVATTAIGNESSLVKKAVTYPNVYNGISEEFVMLKNGVENNTIIHSLTSQLNALPKDAMLQFRQFLPLQSGWKVEVNGSIKNSDFKAKHFHINIPGSETGVSFSPIVVFDHSVSKDEANYLAYAPWEKLNAQQKQKKEASVYECEYYISFVNGGIEVNTLMPADWLKVNGRTFPVTIDPTVTFTPASASGDYHAPTSNWYGYQRHADLYLASEIGVNNVAISAIEYNRTNTNGTNAVKPYEVYMKTTAATQLSGTAAWNSTTYTGGLTPLFNSSIDLHGTTIGWKMITLTAPFTYTSDNLLIMVKDAYGSTGSTKYISRASGSSVSNRQAYMRQDNTDPGDGTSTSVESYLPEIRLTYNFLSACSGTPTAGTAYASANVCPNVAFTLNDTASTAASGITYQWQESPAGLNTWSDIVGATNANYTISTGITTATDYQLIVTCTNSNSSDTSNLVSVAVNPFSVCYCTPVSNCTNEGIINVTFDALNNSSAYCATSGYSNYTSLGALATVTQAQVTPITVSARVNDVGGNNAGVWIDYDHSGTFDANEYTSLGNTGPISTTPDTFAFTGNINIPATAMTGITGMRVREANASGITATSACNTGTVYGEYEDYLITINAGTACNGQPAGGTLTASLANVSCTGTPFTLSATGYSSGITGLTFQWQESSDNINFTDIGPDTVNYYDYAVSSISQSMYYRLLVTCVSGATSGYSDTATVTFAMPAAPYTYDVESQNANTNSVMNNCWTSSPTSTSGYAWHVTGSGTTPSSGTGPTSAHSGNKFFFTEASNGSTGNVAELISPQIDISGLTTPQLDFWYYMYGTNIDKLVISAWDGTAWQPVDSLLGQQQTSQAAPWLKRTVSLAGFTSQTQVKFTATRGGGLAGDISIDDIAIIETPTCAAPTSVTASNQTSNSIDIAWTQPGTSSQWSIEYGPTGFTPGSGSYITGVTTNPYTVTGLAPSTTYDFYVRAVCSGSDSSILSAPVATLNTNQLPVTVFPWTEDWETGGTNWTILNGTQTNKWFVGSAVANGGTNSLYVSNNNGTANAYTLGSTSVVHAYRDINFPAGSPAIDLSFDWHNDGENGYDYLRVWLVPNTFTPTPGTQVTAANSGGIQLGGNHEDEPTFVTQQYTVPASFAGTNSRLIFEWRNDGSGGTQPPAAVDNVTITVGSCATPTALTATALMATSANFGWTENSGATLWQIEYGPQGFTQGTGTYVIATSNPESINGLTDATDYDFYVRSICSPGDTSAWSSVYSFTTPCLPAGLPLTETFESSSTTLNCWSVVNGNGDGDQWALYTSYPHNGSSHAGLYTDGNSGANDDWLISPAVTLTGNQRLIYWYRARSAGEPNDYMVKLSTTGNDTGGFTTVLKPLTSVANTTYQSDTINLSAYSGTAYIAFHVPPGGQDGWYLYIDDVTIEDIPTACNGTPSPGTAYAPAMVCPNVPFTLMDTAYTVALGITYQWQESPAGAGFWTDISGATTVNYTVAAGITTPMDYQLIATCINGGGSDISNTVSIGINPPTQCYCTPYSGSSTSSDIIAGFQLDTLNNVSGGTNTNGYSDFTSMVVGLSQNVSYTANVTSYTGTLSHGIAIWIDLNDDGAFDATERLGTASNVAPSTTTPIAFTLSASAPLGLHRLRVMYQYNVAGPSIDPCVGVINGETEDYMVEINPAPTCVPPSGLAATNTTATSTDLSWTENGTATQWSIEYGPTGFTPGTGTFVGTTSNPYTLSGLSSSTIYDIYVKSICSTTDSSFVNGPVSINTLQIPVSSYPYAANWDNGNGGWTYANGSQANKWFVGAPGDNPAYATGTTPGGLYISNDGGLTNDYDNGSSSVVHAYRDLDLSSFSAAVPLTFNSYIVGEGATTKYDYLSVWIVPITYEPVPGTNLNTVGSATQIGSSINLESGWTQHLLNIPASATGGTARLVLQWRNDGSSGSAPVKVDNLTIGGFPLVVKLKDISATNLGAKNRVDWSTESELKSDKFELERSADGRNFTYLATISAKGEASNYSYMDLSPVTGVNYYRLKMIDAAGVVATSKVVTATVKQGAFTVEAYPNPVSEKLTVQVYGGSDQNATVSITDVTGKVMKVVNVVNGKAEVNMNGLASGVYLVKYTDSNHSQTIKVNKN